MLIPKTAKLNGTIPIMYYDDEIGKLVKKRFHDVVNNTCKVYGAKSIIKFNKDTLQQLTIKNRASLPTI